MTFLMPLGRFDVKGEHLECREIRVLEIRQPGGALLREPTNHISGEDQEPGPGHQRQHGVRRQPGCHSEAFDRLEEKRERGDEHRRSDRKAPPAKETRKDHRQIVEAEKGEFLVDEAVDHQQGSNEQQHEDALEILQQESLHEVPFG